MVNASKILILALDSLNLDVLRLQMDAGRMPVLQRLFSEGTGGVLDSTVPYHTAAAWNTLATGKDPGTHGIVNFRRYDPRTRVARLNSTKDLKHRTLWQLLDEHGLRVGVVGQPMSWPLRPLKNGFAVSGFETPSTRGEFTWPPELKKEVLAAVPNFRFKAERGEAGEGFRGEWTSWEDFQAGLRSLTAEMEAQHALNLHLGRARPWDVLFLYWQAPDPLFHKAWRWCAPETGGEDPRRAEAIGRFFSRLDEMLGEALALPGAAEALLLLCSDHGHGPVRELVRVNNLLADLGRLRRGGVTAQAKEGWRRVTGKRVGKGLGVAVDWRRTQAYMPYEAICGFVHLNLAGREPEGIVPVAEALSLARKTAAELREAKSSLTGEPLFDGVDLGAELYAGHKEFDLAELILRPARGVNLVRKLSFGSACERPPVPHKGTHRPEGFFLLHGKGVKAGQTARAGIADLAPSLAAAAGVPVPADMTGRVLTELFSEPPEVRRGPPSASDAGGKEGGPGNGDGKGGGDAAADVYSKEERLLVERRLAALGYLE